MAAIERALQNAAVLAGAAVSRASSPEEAYKAFFSVFSPALCQAIADGLATAADQAVQVGSSNTAIDGWQEFIKGGAIHADFGVPIDPTVVASSGAAFDQVPVTKIYCHAPAAVAFRGGSISIGGSWSF